MEKAKKNFKENKKQIVIIAVLLTLMAVFFGLRENREAMNSISCAAMHVKQLLALCLSIVPVSVAEILVAAAIVFVVVKAVQWTYQIIKSNECGKTVLHKSLNFICFGLSIYFALCIFLGASYYSDGFQEKSGIYAQPEKVDRLYEVTEFFAKKLAETSCMVERDENGIFAAELGEIFENSTEIYFPIEEKFEFLKMRPLEPKRVLCSHLMSVFSYTGFYFPFTGEANINIDSPNCLIPSTIAHELAHQRGIASEQEANFVAILACTESGIAEYEYSGYLLGFIHLINALYSQDRELFSKAYEYIPEEVLCDIEYNNAYWDQFESKAAEVSETVYDTFLKSYGQEMGVKSYGAVVDLLIAYFR